MAFSILEIEMTKEETLIKEAYRNHLVNVNPEDDPEGFKKLREAYETACIYARTEEVSEKEETDTPIGRWMTQIKQRYASFRERMNEEGWKKALREDICLDLESSLEVRNELLKYLMNHFRLKKEIWQLIDERFLICEEKQELLETFPKDFIDFIVYQCQTEDEPFSYEWFEGADDADYDSFLSQYYQLVRLIDEQDYEKANEIINYMDSLFINHPLFALEKARIAQAQKKGEQACDIVDSIIEKYGMNLRIKTFGAQILWENGRLDRAAKLFLEVAEQLPDHYLANKRLGHYYLEKGDYEKAKTYTLVSLRTGSQEEELLEDIDKINEALIVQLERECEEQPENVKRHLDLAWCYLQTQRIKKGIELLKNLQADEKNQTEYYSAIAKFYFVDEQYENALEFAIKWRECIEEEIPETEEEQKKIPERISAAYELAAELCEKLLEEKKDLSYLQKGLEYIDKAIEKEPDNMRNYVQKASIYKTAKKYEEVVQVCNRMEEKSPDYFWTYIYRQEACEMLGDIQGVIDDFYKAYYIFSHYPAMYEKTVKAFLDVEQWEDALSILERAKEASVMNVRLKLDELTAKRGLAKNKKDWENLYEAAVNLKKELQGEEETKPEELAEVFYETARSLRGLNRQDEALKAIEEAIRIKPDNQYIWIKGNILLSKKEYVPALHLYQICEKEFPDNDLVLGNIGICYKHIPNHTEQAITYLKKVLDNNPNNMMANAELSDIYSEMFSDTEDLKYYELALPYASRQIELTPEAYYYIERGLLHMDAWKWEDAVADFEKAAELEPDNTYAYNNMGCVYKYTKQYEKAIKVLEKAAEVMKEGETMLPFGNLGDTYERMGEYEKALEFYLKNEQLFPNNRTTYQSTMHVYRMLQRFEEAMQKLSFAYEENTYDYYEKKGEIYEEMGDFEKALKAYKKAAAQKGRETDGWNSIGYFYLNIKKDAKAALKAFQKSFGFAKKGTSQYQKACEALITCYHFLKKEKEARRFFSLSMEYYQKKYGGVENYINGTWNYRMARLYTIGKQFLEAGYLKEAEQYFIKMEQERNCKKCSYTGCKEYYAARAFLAEDKGEVKNAIENFKKVLAIDPNWSNCRMHLERLQEG